MGYYNGRRIPRKLKKKVKKYMGVHWEGFTNGQRLWSYLDESNPEHKKMLIRIMCSEEKAKEEMRKMHRKLETNK